MYEIVFFIYGIISILVELKGDMVGQFLVYVEEFLFCLRGNREVKKDFKQLSDWIIYVIYELNGYCLEEIGLKKGKVVSYCSNVSKKEWEGGVK